MSVPDWFSNLIQTAEAAELHQYQETGATSTVQAQEEAVAEAVSNTGYEQPQQQQSPQSSSSHSGFPSQQQQHNENFPSTSQYPGDQPQWMHSGNEHTSFAPPDSSHHQHPSLARLAFELNDHSRSYGNTQPQPSSSSSSSTPVGLVSLDPVPDSYIPNPSSSLAGSWALSPPPPPPAPLVPEATLSSTSPTKCASSSASAPTLSPQTKRRKSDTLKPESIPLLVDHSAAETKLEQAVSSLKSNVPALRAFFHMHPFPDPTDGEGLVDGVLPPTVDGGQSTVVSTSASYVRSLQRERDAGRRMIAGLEGVLKATGGEEMLDAWKAQLAVAEEERAEAEALVSTLASQNTANQNGKGKEVDRSFINPNNAPSPPSSSTLSILRPSTIPSTHPPSIKLEPSSTTSPIIAPIPSFSSTNTYTINPSAIDPLHPNYYDPTTYLIESHDFMTYPSGDSVVGPSKQEIAREKNKEKQRRFRERQKVKVADLEAKLRELKKAEKEQERVDIKEEGEDELEVQQAPVL